MEEFREHRAVLGAAEKPLLKPTVETIAHG